MPEISIRLNENELHLYVAEEEAGHPLKDILEHHGINVPSDCGGVGKCGLCLVHIEAGDCTPLTPSEQGTLSADEIGRGCRLACQARPLGDIGLSIDKLEKLQVWLDLEPSSQQVVMASPSQLQQAMMNLANNARDALADTKEPEIRLSLSAYEADRAFRERHPNIKADRLALIEVQDNGCGISQECIDKVFEPFFSTKEPGKGTGLGLSMVYGTVMDHTGAIEVESSPGKGSTFRMFLPLELEQQATEKLDAREVPSAGGETILMADDDQMLLMAYADILKSLGYKVIPATNGREALEAYKANSGAVDVVILDVVMPEMGGVETADAMRQLKPDQKILFSTGYDLNQKLLEHLDQKKENIISKPWDIAQVSKVIRDKLSST